MDQKIWKVISFITLGALLPFSTMVGAGGFSNRGKVPFAKSSIERPKYAEDEVIIQFHKKITTQQRSDLLASLGRVTRSSRIGQAQYNLVRLSSGQTVEQAVAQYSTDPRVAHVQPNFRYYALATANDASYGQQWGLKNTGQTISSPSYGANNPGIAGADIDAELAWDHITDCSSVVVAVLDEGINYTHTDLAANMWDGSPTYLNHGWDFVDADNDPYPPAGSEHHGTHVAGIIGSVGNTAGISGVCQSASIMSVRVLGPTGGSTADIIAGITFAVDNGAKIINMSLGGGGGFDALYSDAITYAQTNDVIVVVAAGNDGTNNDVTPVYPCNFTQPNLVCVSALDQSYSLADFTNFGATSVDVGAPGTNILSNIAGTSTIESFTSGWTMGTGWGQSYCVFGGVVVLSILSNPANWCSGGVYSANLSSAAYKTFDLSAASAATVYYYYFYVTESGIDVLTVGAKSSGGNPFVSGTTLQTYSGMNPNYPKSDGSSHELTSFCLTATCSIGYLFSTDASTQTDGISIIWFGLDTITSNPSNTAVWDGTSMAAPMVSGIAAMVRAYNPSYTAVEAAEAIRYGGQDLSVLSTITTSGKAVNAMGSLAYITAPKNVSAAVVP